MNVKGVFSSKTDEWATPQYLFDQLDAEFHFDLDPAATDENHKCEQYFTKDDDGLKKSWGGVQSILQSTIRQTDRQVGGEELQRSAEAQHHGGYVASCKDRQRMVSRLHLGQSRDKVHSWASAVWREQTERTVRFDDRDMEVRWAK